MISWQSPDCGGGLSCFVFDLPTVGSWKARKIAPVHQTCQPPLHFGQPASPFPLPHSCSILLCNEIHNILHTYLYALTYIYTIIHTYKYTSIQSFTSHHLRKTKKLSTCKGSPRSCHHVSTNSFFCPPPAAFGLLLRCSFISGNRYSSLRICGSR